MSESISDSEVMRGIQKGYMIVIKPYRQQGWWIKGNSHGWSYSQLWSAKKYGLPSWYNQEANWCIMDMKRGTIVWRSWDDD